MSRGSRKGSAYERAKAKQLSLWLYNDDTALYRIGGSGARATVHSKNGCNKLHPGDIVPVSVQGFPFAVECKNYGAHKNVWSFDDLLKPTKKRLMFLKWWRGIKKDAKRHNLVPLLIFTKNHHPDYLACQPGFLNLELPRISFHVKCKGEPEFVVYRLEHVMRCISGREILDRAAQEFCT